MEFVSHEQGERRIAELVGEGLAISNAGEALDLLGNAYYQGFDGLILHVHQLPDAFFDLRNGLAGEVLQKFSNYRMPLAIVGDATLHPSKALQDFIRESNQGKQVNFRGSVAEALNTLFHA